MEEKPEVFIRMFNNAVYFCDDVRGRGAGGSVLDRTADGQDVGFLTERVVVKAVSLTLESLCMASEAVCCTQGACVR